MKGRMLLTLLLAAALAGPALAGLFNNNKKQKIVPSERVPELLSILKNDGDETKRLEAAEELRQYDPVAFPQIFPALMEALHADPKPSVRAEAAQSLGKLRPVSMIVRQALEHARDKDSSMRVRLQARSSLLSYYWAGGYSNTIKEPATQGKEPPLANSHVPKTIPSNRVQSQEIQPVDISKGIDFDPSLVPQPKSTQNEPANPSPKPGVNTAAPSLFRFLHSSSAKPAVKTTEPPLATPPSSQNSGPVANPSGKTGKQAKVLEGAAIPSQTGPELGPPPQ